MMPQGLGVWRECSGAPFREIRCENHPKTSPRHPFRVGNWTKIASKALCQSNTRVCFAANGRNSPFLYAEGPKIGRFWRAPKIFNGISARQWRWAWAEVCLNAINPDLAKNIWRADMEKLRPKTRAVLGEQADV